MSEEEVDNRSLSWGWMSCSHSKARRDTVLFSQQRGEGPLHWNITAIRWMLVFPLAFFQRIPGWWGPQTDIGSCWGFWVLITQVLAWLQLLKSGSIAPSLPKHLCSLWKAESEIRVNLSPMNWGHWVPSPKGNLLKAAARLFLSVKVGQLPESFGGLESLPDSPKSQMAGQQLSPLGVCPPPTHLCRSSLQALSCTSGGEYKCLFLDSHMPYLAGIFYIFRWKLFMACDPGHWRAQKTTDLWQAWRATILAALSLLSVGNLFLNDLSVIYGSQRAGVNSILSN